MKIESEYINKHRNQDMNSLRRAFRAAAVRRDNLNDNAGLRVVAQQGNVPQPQQQPDPQPNALRLVPNTNNAGFRFVALQQPEPRPNPRQLEHLDRLMLLHARQAEAERQLMQLQLLRDMAPQPADPRQRQLLVRLLDNHPREEHQNRLLRRNTPRQRHVPYAVIPEHQPEAEARLAAAAAVAIPAGAQLQPQPAAVAGAQPQQPADATNRSQPPAAAAAAAAAAVEVEEANVAATATFRAFSPVEVQPDDKDENKRQGCCEIPNLYCVPMRNPKYYDFFVRIAITGDLNHKTENNLFGIGYGPFGLGAFDEDINNNKTMKRQQQQQQRRIVVQLLTNLWLVLVGKVLPRLYIMINP